MEETAKVPYELKPTTLDAYCDGACTTKGSGGWAFFDGENFYSGKVPGISTNNVAEYMGLINLLKHLKKKRDNGNLNSYNVKMDSELVVNQVNNIYECRKSHLIPLKQEAAVLATELAITLEWETREHTMMRRVDVMAKEAARNDSLNPGRV